MDLIWKHAWMPFPIWVACNASHIVTPRGVLPRKLRLSKPKAYADELCFTF